MTDRSPNQRSASSADGRQGRTLTAEEARQGYVVLKTRRRRAVFVGGLVGLVVVALVLALASLAAT